VLCKIIINPRDEWVAEDWMARNLAAYLYVCLTLAKTKVEARFAELFSGSESVVDLTTATVAEIEELLAAARSARKSVKPPSKWEEPASGQAFIAAFDRFVEQLRMDSRVQAVR
jgi:hypothetical protein